MPYTIYREAEKRASYEFATMIGDAWLKFTVLCELPLYHKVKVTLTDDDTGDVIASFGTYEPTPAHARDAKGPFNCNIWIQNRPEQVAYPRTCTKCGLGPCPYFNNDGTVKASK